METETVVFQENGLDVRIVVSQATSLQGFKRTRLKLEADSAAEADPDRRVLRGWVYADLIAATVTASGIEWPLSFDAFAGLSDRLTMRWEAAVYRQNPHWLPEAAKSEDPKAPATESISGSSSA
jgi:hypothetical protein